MHVDDTSLKNMKTIVELLPESNLDKKYGESILGDMFLRIILFRNPRGKRNPSETPHV